MSNLFKINQIDSGDLKVIEKIDKYNIKKSMNGILAYKQQIQKILEDNKCELQYNLQDISTYQNCPKNHKESNCFDDEESDMFIKESMNGLESPATSKIEKEFVEDLTLRKNLDYKKLWPFSNTNSSSSKFLEENSIFPSNEKMSKIL